MEKINDFDWKKYDGTYKGGNQLIKNNKIKGQNNKNICYSYENYAQELFEIYTDKNQLIIKKDLQKGDVVKITNIYNFNDETIKVELLGGLSVNVNLSREKKFMQIFGFNTIESFISALNKKENVEFLISEEIYAFVLESSPTIKISLWQGYIKKMKTEFMQQISVPSKAYVAKIIETNKGGYFVEVQGVEAFMPGSLAAPNKILNFESLLGKEVIVMVEDFLTEMNCFIVSHKKYIDFVLPKKISELDLYKEYTGMITGTSKYGIFIEFEKIFTGLLHTSKMSSDTLNMFNKRLYKPQQEKSFYIGEITSDNRIILSEENPVEKKEKIEKFIFENMDNELKSEINAIMPFGIIVNIDEFSGLIPNKEFKRKKILTKNYTIGDTIIVKYDNFKDNKLLFKLT